MNNPLVSIIVPVYQVEEYLDDCVFSLINQGYQNLEVLLIDDGSTDDSATICNLWANTDERIRVFHNSNHGLSAARNYGIKQAHGEYLLFVDSDDFLDPRAVAKAVRNIGTSDMLVFGTKELVNDETKIHNFSKKEEVDYDQYWERYFEDKLDFNYIVSWNKLCRRAVFDDLKFRNEKINEDAFMVEKLVSSCQKITLLNEPLYFYRRRSDSITTKSMTGKNYDGIQARLERSQEFLAKDKVEFASKTLKETNARMLNIHQKVVDNDNETPFYKNRYLRLTRIYRRLLSDTIQEQKEKIDLA